MRNFIAPALLLLTVATLPADVLRLRDGRTLNGRLVSATSRQIRFVEEGQSASQTFQVTAVERLSFGDTTTGSRTSGSLSDRETASRTRTRTGTYSIPAGSVVTLRLIDSVNSDQTNVGDTYRASLESPIVVEGKTLAPKGADATVRIDRVEQAGAVSGREEIALVLNEVVVNGERYRAESEPATVSAESRGKESVKVIGGGAVLGAIIGAIAGGGKGAAIGAATGAGAGAAVQAIRGQKLEIPSETLLDFRLAQPMSID